MKRAKYISNGTITYKIVGEQGPQGPKGEVGPQGPAGPKGPKGDAAPAEIVREEINKAINNGTISNYDDTEIINELGLNTEIIVPEFENGAISNNTGNEFDNTGWSRSKDYITINKGSKIVRTTDKNIYVHKYVGGVWQTMASHNFSSVFGEGVNTEYEVQEDMVIKFAVEGTLDDAKNAIKITYKTSNSRIDNIESVLKEISESTKEVTFNNAVYSTLQPSLPQVNDYSSRTGDLTINIGYSVKNDIPKEKCICVYSVDVETNAPSVPVRPVILDNTASETIFAFTNMYKDCGNGTHTFIGYTDLSIVNTSNLIRVCLGVRIDATYTYKFTTTNVAIIPIREYFTYKDIIANSFSSFKESSTLTITNETTDGSTLKEASVRPTKLISSLYGKKIIALGDSYTNTDASNRGSYLWRIASRTGANVKNYGLNGSEVMEVPISSIDSFQERWSTMDSDADIVIVFGGINDCARLKNNSDICSLGDMTSTDVNTFYGAYKTLLNNLIDKYPESIIMTVVPPIIQNVNSDQYGVIEFLPVVRKAIIEISAELGIPVCDLYARSNMSNRPSQVAIYNKSETNIHRNNKGLNRMSILIQRDLENLFVDETLIYDVDYLTANQGGTSV